MKNLLWGVVLGTLLLSACGAPTASQPTPVVVVVVITNTPPPSATVTAVPPTPSATLAPSMTPQPSPTPLPTEVATVTPILGAVCKTEVAAFKAQILAVRKAYRPLVDDVYNYSVELLANDYDEADVASAFAGIDAIVVPSCVDAGEILYYFRLLRDTLGPAYVEMRIESALQYPSQESFELVAGWYEEIKGYEKNINALIATLP